MTQDRPAGALNTFATPSRNLLLAPLSTLDLCHELIARLSSPGAIVRDSDIVVASQLQDLLDRSLDVHLNRFSRRRLIDTTHAVFAQYRPDSFGDATIVDLGCGSLNPYAFGFLFPCSGPGAPTPWTSTRFRIRCARPGRSCRSPAGS
jgi:hypothetical protein